jgi:hypothetical protein
VDDRALVSWQLGRPARAFRRVAVRCPHGFPAVSEQRPHAGDGTPFPTTFWLTCPWLVAEVSRVEAAGGVRRYSEAVTVEPALAASLARAHEEQRRLRPQLEGGVAGSRRETGVKCLHAHVAFGLARPGYALADQVIAEIDEPWCPDARCGAAPEEPRE